MKCEPYPATNFALKTLRLLTEHPGLRPGEFAAFCWPHRRKAGLLAAINLHKLVKKGLIRSRFEPPPWKKNNPIKPRKRFYVTDKGFAVHEFHSRQRRPEDGNASDHDRAG
jgi:hypothetical protein